MVVRTIKNEYLIAMKMVAARKYKHDYSDIFGIIKENNSLSLEKIKIAIIDLYGSLDVISEEMMQFVVNLFNNPFLDYAELEMQEEHNKETIVQRYKK